MAKRAEKQPDVRIGISGFTYARWRGVFYPKGLPHARELEYASRKFNSIELNGTFYGMQRPESFKRWYDQTPDDFRFAIKGSRFITHMKKLKDVRTPLANFFASGPLALNEKLGPILWQLGPSWPLDEARVEAFLEMLPRTTDEAAHLAKCHDSRVKGRAWTRIDRSRPLRHAIEPRHPSFFSERFVRMLRRWNTALVFADTADTFPYAEDVTADFVYLRLHGTGELYVGGYSDAQLEEWSRRVCAWMRGREPNDARRVVAELQAKPSARRDVYVYFDNDAKLHAPFNALTLERTLAPKIGRATAPDPVRSCADEAATSLTREEVETRRAEMAQRWKGGRARR